MNQEFLNLGGYGLFIWPAFMFTFACIYILFVKSMREYNKQEKIFLSEFKQNQKIQIKNIKQIKNLEEVFTVSSNS